MARTAIERYRGDTKDLVIKLTQDSVVFDLTGFSAILSVSADENPTGSTYILLSTATIDTTAGRLTFEFGPGDVDQIGDYYYDIELTDAAGKTSTIRKGPLKFLQDISK